MEKNRRSFEVGALHQASREVTLRSDGISDAAHDMVNNSHRERMAGIGLKRCCKVLIGGDWGREVVGRWSGVIGDRE